MGGFTVLLPPSTRLIDQFVVAGILCREGKLRIEERLIVENLKETEEIRFLVLKDAGEGAGDAFAFILPKYLEGLRRCLNGAV